MEMPPLNVFLCHCSYDKPQVRELYKRLQREKWIRSWFDEESLVPGQEWDLEIKKAIRNADVILVCMSRAAITKEGYIQKEIKIALDFADEKPEDTIYIVPLRLEDCEVPTRLSKYQWCDFFGDNDRIARGYDRLLKSLQKRRDALEFIRTRPIESDSILPSTPGGKSEKFHVLWVEDSAKYELREFLGALYYSGNHRLGLELASDVTSATRQVCRKKFDLIILSVHLPPGTDAYWRKIYQFDLSLEGGGIGLRFLHWLAGHDPFCPYDPPDGFDSLGIAIFSTEPFDKVKPILEKMNLVKKVIFRQKNPGMRDTALLDLIDEVMSS